MGVVKQHRAPRRSLRIFAASNITAALASAEWLVLDLDVVENGSQLSW